MQKSFIDQTNWMIKSMRLSFKKISLCMKLCVLFLICSISLAYANDTYAQKTEFSITVTNQTVKSVLKEIENNSDFDFFFSNKYVDVDRIVSISTKNENVFKILDRLFAGTDVVYSVLDKKIILTKKGVSDQNKLASVSEIDQTKHPISGKVLDSNGDPIIGANVLEKGTTNGTITNIDGEYSLNIENNAILIVSYIGYSSVEVSTTNKKIIDITLTEDTKVLNEVVVTALGLKREEKSLGYSVQKIGGDQLQAVKGVDVSTSLTGKISGLTIFNSSEIAEKPTLELRGESPLIVVDGIAYGNVSINDFGAEDIESIDVLKGATASALYGERGRTGAIMITTKKADKEGTLTVNASNNTMFSTGYLRMPETQHSYSAGNYGKLEYGSGFVWGDYMDGHEVEQYDPETMAIKSYPLLSRGKNNIKNFIRSTLVTNTNISVAQASKNGGFRVSATQVHYNGQYPNTSLNKYIVNGSGNIKFNKLTVDASLSYKKEKAPNMPKVNYGNGNIFYNMLIWTGTEYDIRDYRNYWAVKDQKQNWMYSAWYDNPYYLVYERIDEYDKNLFSGSGTITYDFTKDLKLMLRSGYDNYNNNEEQRKSIGDSGERLGWYAYGDYTGESFNNDLILSGKYKVNNLTIDALVGGSTYWYKDKTIYAATRGGLSVPGFYSLNSSIERPSVKKTIEEKALYSAYGKLSLAWKEGIYLDLTGRNDWSSTLPSNSRSYFYPSASLSIVPTSFYNPISDVLDFWKIRASWTVAKKDLSVYDINQIYNVSIDVWDGLSSANYPSSMRDPNCKPEKETSIEIGTNLRFFGNRLGFDYTYFTRLRSNRLINATVSSTSGFSTVITNTGEELRQKGMEFTITGKPIVSKNFSWNSTINLSFYHWYFAKMDPVYSSQDPRISVGKRTDQYFIIDWARDSKGNIIHQAGLPVKNKFYTIDGNKDPNMIIGFSNTFAYKEFSLDISIDGRLGGKMFSWTEQSMWNSGTHPDSDNQWRYDEVVNGLQNYVGQGVKVTSGSATYDPYGKVISDDRVFAANDVPVSYQNYITIYNENSWDHNAKQNILDASFIKLREIALNYNVPTNLINKIRMKSLKVGIIAQNLLMWTKAFKYSDPDRGKENLNSPTPRNIGFNINLSF